MRTDTDSDLVMGEIANILFANKFLQKDIERTASHHGLPQTSSSRPTAWCRVLFMPRLLCCHSLVALLAFCQSPKTKAQCDVTGCTEIYHQKDVLNVMCLWRRPFCCNHSKPPPKRWLKTRKTIIILPLFIEIIWAFLQPDFFLKIFTSLTFFP